MRAPSRLLLLSMILWSCVFAGSSRAETTPGGSEKRIALVVGNAAYQAGELATPANDAGLVAQTLQAAGFDVVGARDLDEDSLRRAMRDFADKAAASGPDTVAFVYLSGYGLQLNGENYFAPIDAKIATAADVPVRAMRISDYKRQLAAIPLKARFVVLDAGRNAPFAKTGDPLAGGLALTEAEPGSLIAFNAAPGTVGPDEKGSYGAYAQALVEMIREGGLSPDQLFDRVRLRVSETTQGGEVPWNASKIDAEFVFFQRAPDAPPVAEPEKVAALRARPLREIGAKDAYTESLQRDTLEGYQEFVAAYPRETVTKRVRVLIAARRESATWRRTALANSSNAYWSYLNRYPRGPHAWDARRRLRELSAPIEPPARFAAFDYDVPPPPPEEVVYVERPAVYFDAPDYDLAPPPPPPVIFLPPRPAYIIDLPPPPPVYEVYALPTPTFVPVPTYVNAPDYIAPPPNNVYYQNIHNRAVIDQINQQNLAYSRDGGGSTGLAIAAGAVVGAAVGLAASRVALPPAVAKKAALPGNPLPGGGGPQTRPGPIADPGQVLPGQPNPALPGRTLTPTGQPGLGQALPGQNGMPLPTQATKPGQPGLPGQPATQQANQPAGDGKPGLAQPLLGPDGKPLPQQANKADASGAKPGEPAQTGLQQANQPGQPGTGGKPGPAPGLVGPNAQPSTQQADKAVDPASPGAKPGTPGQPATQQANQPVQPRIGGKPGTEPGVVGPNGQPSTQKADKAVDPASPGTKLGNAGQPANEQQANQPVQPRIGGKPGTEPGVVGPNGQPSTQKADKAVDPASPGTKPGNAGQPANQQQANQPVQPRIGGKPGTAQPSVDTNGQAPNQQAAKPSLPVIQQQANQPRVGVLGNKAATGQSLPSQSGPKLPQQANKPNSQPSEVPQPKLVLPAQPQPKGPSAASQNAAQQQAIQKQQAAQAAAQQRAAAQQQQQQQAAQQRALVQQQQAAQQRANQQQQAAQQRASAQQQQAVQQRQLQMQQQANQQRAAMQQQQQAAQQRAAAQQQQAMQQRQMMMQQQQMAQQRQMQAQQQQQAAQRQQMMARPQVQPQQQIRGGNGAGRPPCPPGMPCR